MALLVGSSLSGLGGRRGNISTLLGLLSAPGKTVNLVLAVLLDEGDEILNGAGASVLNGRVLGTSGVDLDGGEASDGVRHVVGSGINLGDGNLLVQLGNVSVQSGELIVLGSKTGNYMLDMSN